MRHWYEFRAQMNGAEIVIYDEIGAFGQDVQVVVGDQGGDLDDDITTGIQSRHLQIHPDEHEVSDYVPAAARPVARSCSAQLSWLDGSHVRAAPGAGAGGDRPRRPAGTG